MTNPYYSDTGSPGKRSFGSSAQIRAEFALIEAGFDKMPVLTGNGGKTVRISLGETGLEADPNTYLTATAAAAGFVAKGGDTMSGALSVNAAAVVPLAIRNLLLDGSSTAGVTGLFLGDSASGVAMVQRSKRTANTAGLILNVENGYGAPLKVAEFYPSGLDLFTAGVAALSIDSSGAASMRSNLFLPTDARGLFFDAVGSFGTGIARNGAALQLYAGGASRYSLTSAGSTTLGTIVSQGGEAASGYGFRVVNAGNTGGGELTALAAANGGVRLSGDAGPIHFYAGGSERMLLDASGNLGVGITAPLFRLDVQSPASLVGTPTNVSNLLGGIRIQGSLANACSDAILFQSGGGGGAALVFTRDGNFGTSMRFFTNPTGGVTGGLASVGPGIDQSGILNDAAGLEYGYRDLPQVSPADGATLTVSMRGKSISGGYTALTVPAGVFNTGASFLVYQNSASGMTLTQGSGLTMRLAGSTTTGSRTIAARGLATVYFVSASECVVSGAGVT